MDLSVSAAHQREISITNEFRGCNRTEYADEAASPALGD